MRQLSNNTSAFFALLRAGLWERETQLLPYGDVDFSQLLSIAEEQSVVGLVAAGLEHVVDIKPAKQDVLQFVGQALQLEQQNTAMNYFIGVMVDKMRKDDIYTLLLKGQGIAQCYEKPLWRSNGDVDFFLSEDNYVKAKASLQQIGQLADIEEKSSKHIAFSVDPWLVELHGTLRCGISFRMDKELDRIWHDTFYGGEVRSWMNEKTCIFLLEANNDAVYVFSHFLKHFYKGGLGIR